MMSRDCQCTLAEHTPKLVVLTGGPGGGKTAVLELARRQFCKHVTVLPEAAGIVYGGGFPRFTSNEGRKAAQRAILHVERELEALVIGERQSAVALCDRGTLDGLAYWPADAPSLLEELRTSREREMERYAAVIHLRTPPIEDGYNHDNPLRIESAQQAAEIDERIALAWDGHPRRFFVDSAHEFLSKAQRALELIRQEVPGCCQRGSAG
jgi:predicted ATPase